MQKLSWRVLIALAALSLSAAVVAAVVLGEWALTEAPTHLTLAIPLGGTAACLLVAGWGVRRRVQGQPTYMTAIGAARTAMIAQASALVAALFGGALLGKSLVLGVYIGVGFWTGSYVTSQLWMTLFCAVVSVVMLVVAKLVEGWCTIEPPGKDGAAGSGAGSGVGAGPGSGAGAGTGAGPGTPLPA